MVMRGAVTRFLPIVLFLLVAWVALPAAAEPFLNLFTGKSYTQGSDVAI